MMLIGFRQFKYLLIKAYAVVFVFLAAELCDFEQQLTLPALVKHGQIIRTFVISYIGRCFHTLDEKLNELSVDSVYFISVFL